MKECPLNNKNIFKYMKPFDNENISKYKKYDVIDMATLINKYNLEYRDVLNISDSNISFGLEVETEKLIYRKVKSIILKTNFLKEEWNPTHDVTLNLGIEVKSPILYNEKEYWEDLKTICDILNEYSKIGNNAGSHVHIGTDILGSKLNYWINFLFLWTTYEKIIFRFCYGEYLNGRPKICRYAKPISYIWNNDMLKEKSLYELIGEYRSTRYNAVNLNNITLSSINKKEKDNTIEFRCPNGTINPVIWQNNVNLFIKILEYAKSSKFNMDIVKKRYDRNKRYKLNDISWYKEIYIEDALELSDLIFDNNLNKIYFLRQYLKSFEISDNYIKAKGFTAYDKRKVKTR